ncbi:2OG-Fe(II) oxygenase [Kordiimonas sp.]|uniref:2OG-Fe(II) oxygenase n=1 Tax=Kordiimonas sp. TaxID=1970157 RepID=UPI003A92ACF7
MTAKRILAWGEPAPTFRAFSPANARFEFSTVAGRFVALIFFGSAKHPRSKAVLQKLQAELPHGLACFGVTAHKDELELESVSSTFPHGRVFFDESWAIAKQYGLVNEGDGGNVTTFKPFWFLLDPTLRVYASGEIETIGRLCTLAEKLPAPAHHAGEVEPWAPVLMVPRILSSEFCRKLVEYYKNGAPSESGFMRLVDGKTVPVYDNSFKRRKDVTIEDQDLQTELRLSLQRRLVPQIKKVFQFDATRVERYIVACYDSQDKGFFRPHRDNTTPATAHRRFAVTINLNTEEYEGGGLRFPEFGPRVYRAPTGGAVVFSCSLLHEATPVTSGTRFATLPFLYGEADVASREETRKTLAPAS